MLKDLPKKHALAIYKEIGDSTSWKHFQKFYFSVFLAFPLEVPQELSFEIFKFRGVPPGVSPSGNSLEVVPEILVGDALGIL